MERRHAAPSPPAAAAVADFLAGRAHRRRAWQPCRAHAADLACRCAFLARGLLAPARAAQRPLLASQVSCIELRFRQARDCIIHEHSSVGERMRGRTHTFRDLIQAYIAARRKYPHFEPLQSILLLAQASRRLQLTTVPMAAPWLWWSWLCD